MASGQPRFPATTSTPSAIPKRSFPSFSVRRSSTSNVNAAPITQPRASFSTPSITSAVAASPILASHHSNASNTTTQSGVPAGSGIPALRSLRNLLPFGPPKQQTTAPATPSRGPFAGFGSMRKSMTGSREKEKEKAKERMSLSNETYMPVLSIERRASLSQDDPPMRRSISLSHLEVNMDKPLPPPGPESKSFEHEEPVVLNPIPTLRIPSPGPPLLTELSTIIEADSSGISKHVPLLTPSPDSSSFSLQLSNSPSPNDNPEEHTIKRPLPPLMTSSPPLPSTPTTQSPPPTTNSLPSPVPTDVDSPPTTENELELSTSQIVSQVKDAMARTSWRGSDKAFVIDGDTSFLQIRGSSEEDLGNESDDDDGAAGAADDDASLLAMVNVELNSRSSSSSPRLCLMGEDDLSHVNNSVSSVVNPNELRTTEDATLDLGSLDPDLRAAVANMTNNRSFTSMTFQNPASPSVGHSSTSARTITLSSPPPPPTKDTQQGTRSVSASSMPSVPTAAATPAKSHVPPTSSRKRRPASSFLPRLRSPPPHSAPVSAKNSPSPRKTSFDSPHAGGRTRKVTNSHINGIMTGGTSSPRSPVFAAPQGGGIRVPSNGSTARTPTSAVFGGGLVSSTPLKVSSKPPLQQKQGVTGHKKKSSVPVAMWRYSRERGEGLESDSGDGEEKENVGRPEVRVVEASGESHTDDMPSQKRRSDGKLNANGWSPHLLFANKRLEGDSPVLASDFPLQSEGCGVEGDDEARVLGSPFHTPGGRYEKLGVGSGGASPSGRPYSFPSPSHSPSPSSVALPTTRFESSGTRDLLATASVNNDTITCGSTKINQSPNPSLYILPQSHSQSLTPSPLLPPPGADAAVFSRRGSVSGADGEGSSPSRIIDSGSLSGRPSRRLPAPLRMFWGGCNGSNGSNASGSGGSGGAEEMLMSSERQPSPLRSVVRVDVFGRGEEVEEEANHDLGSDGTRPSFDGSVTVSRPSMESTRPSMDSYVIGSSSAVVGSASISARRTPDPGYQAERHVAERSRPPTRLLVERARKRSMSVQEMRSEIDLMVSGRDNVAGNLSNATLSARERLARARYGDLGGGTRPVSSMSVRSSRTESLGVKNPTKGGRVAAGLLEFERERNPTLSGIERSVSERTGEKELVQYRERSGSASGIGTLGRYASLRSASEYNFAGGSASAVNLSMMQPATLHTRPYSRIAFSEASGGSEHGRRGSGTFSAAGVGLMDSPTFTVSTTASGSRDTQRSSSTGATSVSQASMKEREREREELKELREKHATETGALLNALSDSQRSCRVLREENGELRDKIADVEGENERLRRIMGDLEMEVERLKYSRERERGWERTRLRERGWELGMGRGNNRGLSTSVGPGGGGWRGLATPFIKQRDLTLPHRTVPRSQRWPSNDQDSQLVHHHDEPELTIRNSRSKLDNVLFFRDEQDSGNLREEELVRQEEDNDAFSSTSTPPAPTHNRRPSTTSSIFLMPPPNMTMLLHDESAILPSSNRSSGDIHSISGIKLSTSSVLPIPRTLKNNHETNHSTSSNISVSPTENVSMVTGSPGSLFLRPEHEMLLGEMESLDLGRGEKSEPEVWDE